jgi:hypothetical protein
VDAGNPAMGIPVSPGTYTVKLVVGKQEQTQKLEVRPDARLVEIYRDAQKAEAAAWYRGLFEQARREERPLYTRGLSSFSPEEQKKNEEVYQQQPERNAVAHSAGQEQLALRLRDDITKLSQTVARVRALQKQITLRGELLKDHDDAKKLVKDSQALGQKLAALEEKLHNPKAKIVYDIFAARGGAMLYSQLSFLLGSVTDGDGPPTKAQKELADELDKRLAGHVAEFDKLAKEDVAKLNEAAKKLGVPELYVPAAKAKKDEPAEGKK